MPSHRTAKTVDDLLIQARADAAAQALARRGLPRAAERLAARRHPRR